MAISKIINRHTSKAMLSFVALAAIYTLLIFLLPANKSTMQMYHLSPQGYRALLLLATLPPLAVWLAAFLAYSKLYEYVELIKITNESAGFTRIAQGIMWLAWSLPVSSIIGLLANSATNDHTSFRTAIIVIYNHVVLVLPLIGYTLVSLGGRSLMAQTKQSLSTAATQIIMFAFACGGVLYCYITFHELLPTDSTVANNLYAWPVWLIVVSIIIPYLYAWFAGLLAVLEINSYSKHVRGLLYREPLRLKVAGLSMVIVGSIALQFLGAIVPASGHIALDYNLILRLVFLAFIGTGFLMIISGVTRLRRIEEV